MNNQQLMLALKLLELDISQNARAMIQAIQDQRRVRRQRRWWTRDWLLRRPIHGQYEALMSEMYAEDPSAYRNFVQVDPLMFQELLHMVIPKIYKRNTWYRKSIDPGLRLAATTH